MARSEIDLKAASEKTFPTQRIYEVGTTYRGLHVYVIPIQGQLTSVTTSSSITQYQTLPPYLCSEP